MDQPLERERNKSTFRHLRRRIRSARVGQLGDCRGASRECRRIDAHRLQGCRPSPRGGFALRGYGGIYGIELEGSWHTVFRELEEPGNHSEMAVGRELEVGASTMLSFILSFQRPTFSISIAPEENKRTIAS